MKYLTTTLAIACMAFGFASITATPAQANAESCVDGVKTATCINERNAQVNDVESLETQDVAEREDGSGGDFGGSGGDFGESDRAAASTAAE